MDCRTSLDVAPSRGRGLKPDAGHVDDRRDGCRPFTGAWVETTGGAADPRVRTLALGEIFFEGRPTLVEIEPSTRISAARKIINLFEGLTAGFPEKGRLLGSRSLIVFRPPRPESRIPRIGRARWSTARGVARTRGNPGSGGPVVLLPRLAKPVRSGFQDVGKQLIDASPHHGRPTLQGVLPPASIRLAPPL